MHAIDYQRSIITDWLKYIYLHTSDPKEHWKNFNTNCCKKSTCRPDADLKDFFLYNKCCRNENDGQCEHVLT